MDPIKVFITEDESIVREGLRDMIPWSQYGFAFVGDAPDGEMALPMIRRQRPDILITDIKMPFMDGLALSEIVGRELPDTKIIIISGYSDFEYARQAIKLNVDQYLLKPVTRSDMLKALEQTRRKLEEEREQKDYLRRYEQDFKKYERYSRRAFFERLVEGSLSVQEIYAQADALHLDLSADGYNFVLFTLQEPDSNRYSQATAEAFETLLNDFLRYPDYILFRCSLLGYAVLVKGDRESLPEMTARCEELIRRRCEETDPPLNWYAAVGEATDRLSGLPRCYADANHVLAYRHLLPRQHVFHAASLREERNGSGAGELHTLDLEKIDPLLLRGFVRTGLAEETEAFVEEYLNDLAGAERSVLFRHYLLLTVRINAQLALQEYGCPPEALLERIPQVDINLGAEELAGDLTAVLRAALDLRDAEKQKQSGDIINDALRYIDRNYCDVNISLNSVAKAINVSANYLSALFSQKMEISFVEYLTQKRMTRAKQLLRQGSKRSGEIAYEVGYKDPRYFSFVFKKTQGCTPRSYRTGETEGE